MNFLSSLLLAASSNFDTLTLSQKLSKKNITFYKLNTMIISLITTLATFVSLFLGNLFNKYLAKECSNVFGGMLLCFIGFYYFIEHIKQEEEDKGFDTSYYVTTLIGENIKKVDKTLIKDKLTFNDNFSISYILIFDNILIAFSAGSTMINSQLIILINFLITILILTFSNFIKLKYNNILLKYRFIIPGYILIFIGLLQMFY